MSGAITADPASSRAQTTVGLVAGSAMIGVTLAELANLLAI